MTENVTQKRSQAAEALVAFALVAALQPPQLDPDCQTAVPFDDSEH